METPLIFLLEISYTKKCSKLSILYYATVSTWNLKWLLEPDIQPNFFQLNLSPALQHGVHAGRRGRRLRRAALQHHAHAPEVAPEQVSVS